MELPTITATAYGAGTATYTGAGLGIVPTTNTIQTGQWASADVEYFKRARMAQAETEAIAKSDMLRKLEDKIEQKVDGRLRPKAKEKEMPGRRIVRVFIIDPDPKIALSKAVLYKGEEILTDSTDQDLFYDIDVKSLLDKHNEYRTSQEDESDKDKKKLKPIKVSNLIMNVVQVASF